jgi:palmitoyltransferase
MPLVRNTGSLAIRCFKTVESCADRLTGAAGPVFVTICWFLITSGGFAFRESTSYSAGSIDSDFLKSDHSFASLVDVILYHKPWTIPRILFLPLAVLIMTNLYAQYFYATTTPPGNPHSILEEIKMESSWMLETARQRINPSGRGQGSRTDSGRVGLDGTWAGGRLRKCGRCLGPKPIVR